MPQLPCLVADKVLVEAAVFGAIDYKKTLGKTYATEAEHDEALSKCHKRSAERVLKALLANGGTLSRFPFDY